MKKLIMVLWVLGTVSMVHAAITGNVLFSDSYDRPNNTDIDASSDGMAGLLSPMTYVEIGDDVIYPQQSGTGNPYPELTRIESNRLYMAAGTNATTMYLGHNFVDNEILAADGMRIGLTIIQNLGTLTGELSFVGFGVGNTLQECQTTWFDHNGTGFRGQLGGTPQAGTSDLWVGWSPVNGGTIQVFKNGPTAAGGENYDLLTGVVLTGSDRLEVELYFDSFADDAPVIANILWNGTIVGTDRFAWDADGKLENYIGINARQGNGYVVDNLSITTIYEDRAYQPYPADEAMLVNAAGLTLSWNKGKDGSGNPNAAIGQHYLYITEAEPNFLNVSPITVADTADPVTYGGYSFGNDKLYYWRVDESINGSGPADANTITGYVWSFDTFTFPIINTNPGKAVVAPTETAALTCGFTSVTEPTVRWFKEAGEVDVEIVAGGDVTIDLANPSGSSYVSTLTIQNVEAADEGAYYCLVENSSGSGNAVASAAGTLGVKRIVGHWTFDLADFQNGLYLDSSGEGHHAEPNLVPDLSQFVAGADAAKTHEGVDFTAKPLSVADTGDWAISTYTSQMTLSLWVNWAGSNGGWQGLASNRNTPVEGNWYFEIRQDNGNIQLGAPYFASGALQGPNLPVGQWAHVAVTMEPTALVIYVNGQEVNRRSPVAALTSGVFPMYLGALGRSEAGVLSNPFNGTFDDVRFYNYAKSAMEIVDLYYAISETSVCLNPGNVDLSFDVAGPDGVGSAFKDCKVNFYDFAVFAADWLNCGLYPEDDC